MTGWRTHKEDGYCDAAHCRKPMAETHKSAKRSYAVCSNHIDAAWDAACADNRAAGIVSPPISLVED